MANCEQTQGLSVLEHGYAVHNYFKDLHDHVLHGSPLKYAWRLPNWAYDKLLWARLADTDTIRAYQIYHDCGKPFCREIDEQCRVHFPCHASVSKDIWLDYSDDNQVADLIGMDMDIHLLKADGCPEFATRQQAATLLLTGLAEIHANASMFGGIDSVSFKIKWKQIDKRGRVIVGLMSDFEVEKL